MTTTASPEVNELRALFRYLQAFRSLHETEGIDEITTPSGRVWSLWDLEYLYRSASRLLTPAQYRALTLFLVHDVKETEAAQLMGVSPTNPIGMYASLGLRKLLDSIDGGGMDRFRPDQESWRNTEENRQSQQLIELAGKIKEQTEVVLYDCHRFLPTPLGHLPRIRIRSRATASGFLYLHPMQVTYAVHVGPIPPGYRLRHLARHPHHLACVNYEHADLVQGGRA